VNSGWCRSYGLYHRERNLNAFKCLILSMKTLSEIVRIRKNDSCPCGSGKEFKDCCEAKGHSYAYFKYGRKRVVYDLDETNKNVNDILGFTYDRIVALWNSRTMIDKERGLDILKTVYGLADKILEPFLRNSSCKKGCHTCCYYLVQIQAIEAETIRRYVRDNFDHGLIADVRGKIDEASTYYPHPVRIGSAYPKKLRDRHFNLHIPCPFLSDEGYCMVYEARPLIARTCIVFSDPELCKSVTDKRIATYEAYYFPQIFTAVELLSSLVYNHIDYEKHVAHWFVDEFRF
jgi:hypothetical protein